MLSFVIFGSPQRSKKKSYWKFPFDDLVFGIWIQPKFRKVMPSIEWMENETFLEEEMWKNSYIYFIK